MRMTPKELFLKKDDLRTQLGAVVSQDWFQECVCFTVAQMLADREMSADEMRGVTVFLQTFTQMHQKDEPQQGAISTGLQTPKPLKR